MRRILPYIILFSILGCENKNDSTPVRKSEGVIPAPDFTILADKTHNKFSSTIPYKLKVPDGSVIEAYTIEATGGQLNIHSTLEDWDKVDFDKIHTLTGPIYVEGAEPGDVLAVELLDLEPGNWGWTAMSPDMGFLAGENESRGFKTYALDKENNQVKFTDEITIPLKPFLGVIAVAPNTEEMLVTFPPRANGGNMDDPNIVKGTTVYLPVFVEGALLSVGDPHAVQGLGEVVGTAVECDMRARFRVTVIKDKKISEPQYETADYYATTGFGTTIDEAAKKATRYMIEHIAGTYGLSEGEAYMLCSLAGDLKIAEVVDNPHMLVTMHLPKSIFKNK